MRYDADLAAIELARFRDLTRTEQVERRRLADGYWKRALRFKHLVEYVWSLNQSQFVITTAKDSPPPSGAGEAVTHCYHNLIAATGLDPSNPLLWYDLIYFAGILGDWQRFRSGMDAAMLAIGEDADGRYETLRLRLALDYAWWSHPSDYAERWIQAMAYLARGELPQALHALGPLHPHYEFPYSYHYWSDAGLIQELADQRDHARLCYALAAVYRPFFMYYPLLGREGLARVHQQAGTGMAYFKTYDRFYVAGSYFAYAANTALACELSEDPVAKARLAEDALAALGICHRRGIRPRSALALRGRLHFALGDHALAEADLARAVEGASPSSREHAEISQLTGLLQMEKGDVTAAERSFQQAVMSAPEWGSAWQNLGVARIQAGDRIAGRVALGRAVALAPESAVAWYNRGLLNFHEYHWQDAYLDLLNATRLEPDNRQMSELLQRTMVEVKAHRATGAGIDSLVVAGSAVDSLSAPSFPQFRLERGAGPLASGTQDSLLTVALAAGTGNAQAISPGALPELVEIWGQRQAEESQRVLVQMKEAYASDSSLVNRHALTRAYLAAGEARRARDLALPYWRNEASVVDGCLVLLADRALGDVERASRLADDLAAGVPAIADAGFWSLVASICFDAGLNEEGLDALDAAIILAPDNLSLLSQRLLITGQ